MSAMILKLIAVLTMLIDHTAACFGYYGVLGTYLEWSDRTSVYMLCRMIGRMAFPIYCFLIAEGVAHTRNWKKYGLRLAVLALLSEFPFDFALHGLAAVFSRPDAAGQFIEHIDWKHQNVFFTLFLGMLAVEFLRATQLRLAKIKVSYCCGKTFGKEKILYGMLFILRYAAYAGFTFGLGYLAKYVLHTDYGMGGVVMIGIMGLTNEYWEDWFPFVPKFIIRTVICGIGLWVCCQILNSSLEIYGMAALLPIALYNGKKGYSSKAMQYGFYLFYPVHLLVLGMLKLFIL